MHDSKWIGRILGALLSVSVAGSVIVAQVQNSLLAGLSVNGTGRVQPSGIVLATASAVVPPPIGSAPVYHHRAAAQTALRFAVQGLVGRPVILAAGTPAPAPISIGSGVIEIAPATAQIVVNGLAPGNLLDLTAFIGADGDWSIDLPGGVGIGVPNVTLQALIFDPTALPPFYRTTASITLEISGSIDSLMRTVVDGIDQIVENPLLLPSCCSTTFLFDGLDTPFFATQQAIESVTEPFRLFFDGIGPDSSAVATLPTGAPLPGATASLFIQTIDDYGTATCPPQPRRERNRTHGLVVREQNGAWKLDGNQRDASIEFELECRPGTSNAQGLDVVLNACVEDQIGARGGIAGVTLTGPQLSGYDPCTGNATSSAAGSAGLIEVDGGGGGPSTWSLDVNLAVTAAGLSRFPFVVGGAAAADVYSVTVMWNDGSTSGPYATPLRAAFDIATSPSTVLGAIPGTGTGAAVLHMGGTPAATLDFTFNVGSLAGSSLAGASEGLLIQSTSIGDSEVEFGPFILPALPATTTLTLCTPGFVSGATNLRFLSQSDVFGNRYTSFGVLSF